MGFRVRGSTNAPAAGSTSCSPGWVAKPRRLHVVLNHLPAAALLVCGLGCVVW
jgi:hypothetical protein